MAHIHMTGYPKYVQGPGELRNMAAHLAGYGKRFLFVLGAGPANEEAKQRIEQSFAAQGAGCEFEYYLFEGQDVCPATVQALLERVREYAPDLVVGIGGGRTLDIVRAQWYKGGAPAVLSPTAAATNAAGTRLFVIYADETGDEIGEIGIIERYPPMAIVDTELVVRAPARSLAAGICDSVATLYESELNAQVGGYAHRTSSTVWASYRQGVEMLKQNATAAIAACEANVPTPAFEQVVEYVLLWNGMYASILSGMNLAHLLADDLLYYLSPCRKFMHGEMVGYGVLAMMVHAGRPTEEIHAHIDFLRSLGMPATFAQLGIEGISREELLAAAQKSQTSVVYRMFNMHYTPQEMVDYLLVGEQISKNYLAL